MSGDFVSSATFCGVTVVLLDGRARWECDGQWTCGVGWGWGWIWIDIERHRDGEVDIRKQTERAMAKQRSVSGNMDGERVLNGRKIYRDGT